MAKNLKYSGDAYTLDVACTAPTTPASGDPVLVGVLPGVALTDERADGKTTVQFRGVFNLSVEGVNNAGNSAVAVGDAIYYEAGEDPVLNKDSVSGVLFGIALGTVGSGLTATIPVLLKSGC